MDRYDIAIIGTGPAGVSAAITAKVRNKNILLFGSRKSSEKVYRATQIQNYPGLPQISGEELAEQYQKQLDQLEIAVTEERVSAVYAMGSYFVIQASGKMYEASSVILAAGVVQGKTFPGEKELLGRGVSYCATCDAMLYRGKTAAVIGYTKEAEGESEFLAELAEKVYYLPMYKEEPEITEETGKIQIIREKPQAITGTDQVEILQTDKREYHVDGVFILRDSISAEQLVPGLEIEDGHVKVNLQMETNIPGCFACGDVAGKPYQYVKAAGQGNVAALSAVNWLTRQRLEKQQSGIITK